MALGIGVNTVMFAITDAVLVRPLPYRDSDLLVSLTMADPSRGLNGLNVSYTRLTFLEQHTRLLDRFAAYVSTRVSVRTTAHPEEVSSLIVNRSFFDTLGVRPLVGRTFLPEEDRPGGANVAILSTAFWQSHFGGEKEVIGTAVELDGRSVTIIGVLPQDFSFPFSQPEPQIFMPRVFENPLFSADRVQSGAAFLNVIARLQPGASIAQARTELDALTASYNQTFPGNADVPRYATQASDLRESLVGPVRTPLLILFAAAGFVLLIGCVNLATLMLARASSRRKEVAIRRALGASGGRLLWQMLNEAIVISTIGTSLALGLVAYAPRALSLLPAGLLPRPGEIKVDFAVAGFALALCVISALGFALVCAHYTRETAAGEALKDTARGSTDGQRSKRSRIVLVTLEIAITVVLVAGAAALMKSLGKLLEVAPGFDPHDVVSFSLSLPPARYPQTGQQARFYTRLIADLREAPGVDSASAISYMPIVGGTRLLYVCPFGTTCEGMGKDPVAAVRHITPSYFGTMHIGLIRGRPFDDHDDGGSRSVCIINEKAAADFFPEQDPIGKIIVQSRGSIPTVVVGVVRNVRALGLNSPFLDEFYIPQEQSIVPVSTMSVLIRSSGPVQAVVETARKVVATLDPDLPLADVRTLDEVMSTSVAQPKLTTFLTALFAAFALLLAALGIYGMMAYAVSERRHEIAIRMAIGASRADIFRLVIRQGARITTIGVAAGLGASLAVTQVMKGILFNVSPRDPHILVAVALILSTVSLLACYVPTRRAMSVDPISGLRGE